MRNVIVQTTLLLTFLFLSSQVQAQVGPMGPGPDDADMQEMMQMGMQMMQRMQDAGIDMQSIGQQVQDGTFNPEEFTQMLVDKGVLDSETMGKMQKTGTRVAVKFLKQQLGSTDEEWVILGPRVEKVFGAMASLGDAGGAGRMAMMLPNNTSPVAKAMKELKDELANAATNEGKIFNKLKAYRNAVAQVQAELKAARESLQGLLTLRQEVILLQMGLLE